MTQHREQVLGRRVALSLACGAILFLSGTAAAWGADPIATFDTSFGTIQVELLPQNAPYTVQNFLNYVDSGAYDDMFIHRLVYGFVAQTGGYTTASAPFDFTAPPPHIATGPSVINEFGVSNVAGTLAMAKLGGDPNSATSEFFFNLGNNSSNLDNQNGGFTVFGKVIGDSMSVLDALASVRVYDGTGVWGSAFSNIPLVNLPANAMQVDASNMLVIHSISVPRVAGDVNLDGIVNGQDIALTASNWGKSTGIVLGDANGDKTVGDADLAMITQHWLETLPAQTTQTASILNSGNAAIASEIVTGNSVAAVPEPGTLLLAVLAGMACYVGRRLF